MLVTAANIWNINPFQLRAIRQCLVNEPDILVLPELRNRAVPKAQKLLAQHEYHLIHVRVHRLMCLALASRLPVATHSVISEGAFRDRPQLQIGLANGITLFGIHLDAPSSPQRIRDRKQQLAALSDIVQQIHSPVVLAGDFNTFTSEPAFQNFLLSSNLSQNTDSREKLHTWPSFLPCFKIDHILCAHPLKIARLRVGGFNGSDHRSITGCVE